MLFSNPQGESRIWAKFHRFFLLFHLSPENPTGNGMGDAFRFLKRLRKHPAIPIARLNSHVCLAHNLSIMGLPVEKPFNTLANNNLVVHQNHTQFRHFVISSFIGSSK